jgi:cyclase
MQAVKVYNTRDVDELILLDIEATPENRAPDYELISSLAEECFVPLAVGGGIRDIEMVRRLLRVGADKVCINTAVYQAPHLVSEAAKRFGAQCVVVAIDVRRQANGRYECYGNCGRIPTGRDPVEWAKEVEKLGAGEIFLTSIDRDGTLEGYDLGLIQAVSKGVNIPVIASGGAGSYDHMLQAIQFAGASAVAASSMYLFTQNTPLEAKEYLSARGVAVRHPHKRSS